MKKMHKLIADPLNGSIFLNMLIFALPVMGVSLLSVLFGSIDTAVVGRFGHVNAMSAIGASQTVIWTLIAVAQSLNAGVSMVFSRLYGEHRENDIHRLINSLPLSAALIGTVLTLATVSAARPVLQFVNCPELILEDALSYFRIYFCSAPFMVTFCFLSAAIEAKGDSFTPFVFQIIAECINLFLNLLFVIVFDWNVFGVAIATVIAQAFSCIGLTVHLARQDNELKLVLREQRFFTGTEEIWCKGIPSSLEGFALNITAVVVSAFINGFSTAIIAGNTVASSIEGMIYVGFAGFENGSVVFIGQNYGAKNMRRVRKTYLITISMLFLVAAILGSVAMLFAPPLCGLFTADEEIIAAAVHRIRFICPLYVFCGTMNSILGCIRGLQDAKTPLAISVFCSVFFRLSWLMLVAKPAGTIEAVYLAYPLTWILSTLLSAISFEHIFLKRKNELAG